MQLSRTSSVSSPLITGSSSSLCEQHPADSTTSLGEESPLPPATTPSLLIPKFPNILPKKEVTPNTSEILGNLETTVMAMGYAVGTGDDDKGDIDLSDILSSDANLFSTAHEVICILYNSNLYRREFYYIYRVLFILMVYLLRLRKPDN